MNTHWDFTPKQSLVAQGIMSGKSNADIARDIGISEKTVKAHATAIYNVLGVRGRTQAALRLKSWDPEASMPGEKLIAFKFVRDQVAQLLARDDLLEEESGTIEVALAAIDTLTTTAAREKQEPVKACQAGTPM